MTRPDRPTPDAPAPSAALRRRVLEMAGGARSPTRDAIRRWRARVFVSGVLASGAMLFAVGGVQPGARPIGLVVLSAAGWAAIAAAATWAGLTRTRGMLGLPTAWLAAAAALVVPALFAWSQTFIDGQALVRMHPRVHVVCFALTLVLSAVPFALMLTLRRGADPVHPRATGAAMGAAAGAWGAVLVDLHCPIDTSLHVYLGHVAPVALFAGMGAIAGAVVLSLGPARPRSAEG